MTTQGTTPPVGAGAPVILMVDDEPNVLSGFRRSLGRKWHIETAEGATAALALLRTRGPIAVVVTDMQMPGMNGVEFLEQVRKVSKDTVCMMLTGNADQATATQAINRGHVFRFLNKPCPPEFMEPAIALAVKQYELVTAERVLLRDTLTGAIRMLTEAMSQSHPRLSGLTVAVRRSTRDLGEAAGLDNDWRLHIGSSLCFFGYSVMRDITDDHLLTEENLRECAACGSRLLRHIPRLGQVAEVIKRQRERTPFPARCQPEAGPEVEVVLSRILGLAIDIERVRQGVAASAALLEELQKDPSPIAGMLLPVVKRLTSADTAQAAQPAGPLQAGLLDINLLREGMLVEEHIVAADGRVLLAKGYQLSAVTIERLRSFVNAGLIGSEFPVRWELPRPSEAA